MPVHRVPLHPCPCICNTHIECLARALEASQLAARGAIEGSEAVVEQAEWQGGEQREGRGEGDRGQRAWVGVR